MPTDNFLTIPTASDKQARSKRRIWRALDPLHRALLATDGSFTLLLEALANESIQVAPLLQQTTQVREPDELLKLPAGEELLTRNVVLQTVSGRNLVYARSRIVPGRLCSEVVQSLQEGSTPIGLLLRRQQYETYRELIDWGSVQPDPEGQRRLNVNQCIFRSYIIKANHQPIMQVSEYFSPALFEVPHG